MERVIKSARWFLVTIGVVALTSITVDATLNPNSVSQSALSILATSLGEEKKGCPDGSVPLGGELYTVCVDIFEVSPGDACPSQNIASAQDTRANMNEQSCIPISAELRSPWTYVTLHQAQELCGRAGKRLLSNAEWYRASLGTPDTAEDTLCNIRSEGVKTTGSLGTCASGVGVHDLVGNVWEWVDASVEQGKYNGRELPQSGYVAEADQDGIVTKTAEVSNPDYHADYVWSDMAGVYGMLRGGFYGSERDAGIYSLQAKTPPSFAGAAIGFRCAVDIRE